MSTLKKKLLDDLKEAMKNHDIIAKDVIQVARAAILRVEKDQKIQLDDNGVMEVIAKEIKKRKESIVYFEQGQRSDLIDKANKEIDILKEYLGEELSSEELKTIIERAISDCNATSVKDMGKVIKRVKAEVSGCADMGTISEMVKNLLK